MNRLATALAQVVAGLWRAVGSPGLAGLDAPPRREAGPRWVEDLVWGVCWWLCLAALALLAGTATRFIYVDF